MLTLLFQSATILNMSTDVYDTYHFAVGGKSWAVIREFFPDIIPKVR